METDHRSNAELLEAMAESKENSARRIERRGSTTAQKTAQHLRKEVTALRRGAAMLRIEEGS